MEEISQDVKSKARASDPDREPHEICNVCAPRCLRVLSREHHDVILHGNADDFVPCSMSMDCQLAGEHHVQLVLIKGAAHGMSHCVDTTNYEKAAYAFFQQTGAFQ